MEEYIKKKIEVKVKIIKCRISGGVIVVGLENEIMGVKRKVRL